MVRTSGEAAARGILVRSGEPLPLLPSVRVVVLDKTGTVAEGRPHVVARVGGDEVLVGGVSLLAEWGVDCGGEKASDMLRWADAQRQERRTVVFVAYGRQLAGAIALADRLKPEAAEAVAELKRQGLEVVMATGNDERVARAVAAEVGIEQVYPGLLPGQKRGLVCSLRQGSTASADSGEAVS